MAGKPKKKSGWGGKRAGAGRSIKEMPDYDEGLKQNVLKAVHELEEQYKITFEKAMIKLCFEEKTPPTVKATIWNKFVDMFTIKQTRQDLKFKETQHCGPLILSKKEFAAWKDMPPKLKALMDAPSIILPERQPDPALKILRKKKGEESESHSSAD